MLLGRPNLDVDVVVEGDGVAFAEAFGERHGVPVKVHRRFGTAVLVVSSEFHVDVTSARTEYYARPGALPTVERSSLRQDLFRRDFTINAMAACLEPVVLRRHRRPVRRAARPRSAASCACCTRCRSSTTRRACCARSASRSATASRWTRAPRAWRAAPWRWTCSRRSRARACARSCSTSSPRSRRPTCACAARRARRAGRAAAGRRARADALRDAVRAVEQALDDDRRGVFAAAARRASSLWLPRLPRAVPSGRRERWLRHFRFGREYARCRAGARRAGRARAARSCRTAAGCATAGCTGCSSRCPPRRSSNLWARGDALARERIERFVGELVGHVHAGCQRRGPHRDGRARRRRPSRLYWREPWTTGLDGRAVGREAELANLKRLAGRAGLIDPRKDPA